MFRIVTHNLEIHGYRPDFVCLTLSFYLSYSYYLRPFSPNFFMHESLISTPTLLPWSLTQSSVSHQVGWMGTSYTTGNNFVKCVVKFPFFDGGGLDSSSTIISV